ncbi:activin receptor type-2A-like [Tropilaelaps mercedesae]|uniref:Serine/threonine-protein kinase receptor n=1 Tax=Tropilaelaps mercedesae TaxID=418985 RepID=A0A1V9XGM2_9ACAR|nr:activin receptor type-2A-like [Tropilaelaps mercedesae]
MFNSFLILLSLQGCWTGGEHECIEKAASSENSSACYRRRGGESDLLFCCCLDYMCNRNFIPLPPIAPPPSERAFGVLPTSAGGAPTHEQRHFMSSWKYAIAVPAIGLTAIICVVIQRQCGERKNRLASNQFGYDNQLEKSSSVVDGVTLIECVAQGRFGTVWRGKYNGKEVAVKIFPANEKQSWEREKEVYRLPQMQHPNVLSFLGTGPKTNVQTGLAEYWLLTEWHQLGSLHDFLRFNTVTYDQLLYLSDSIARGVMHLHTESAATNKEAYKSAMAHRDIKSRNILLKDDRTACIADFGLAIIFEPGASIGETHGQVGTRRYMSPEVLEGAISFDQEAFQRIDIYALSLTLWELLTRTSDCDPFPEYRLPFEDQVGLRPSLEDMQDTVVTRKIRPSIRDTWRKEGRLALFVSTLEECWDADADARLNACTVHERIQQLIRELNQPWMTEIPDEKSALLSQNDSIQPNGIPNGVGQRAHTQHQPLQQPIRYQPLQQLQHLNQHRHHQQINGNVAV